MEEEGVETWTASLYDTVALSTPLIKQSNQSINLFICLMISQIIKQYSQNHKAVSWRNDNVTSPDPLRGMPSLLGGFGGVLLG